MNSPIDAKKSERPAGAIWEVHVVHVSPVLGEAQRLPDLGVQYAAGFYAGQLQMIHPSVFVPRVP